MTNRLLDEGAIKVLIYHRFVNHLIIHQSDVDDEIQMLHHQEESAGKVTQALCGGITEPLQTNPHPGEGDGKTLMTICLQLENGTMDLQIVVHQEDVIRHRPIEDSYEKLPHHHQDDGKTVLGLHKTRDEIVGIVLSHPETYHHLEDRQIVRVHQIVHLPVDKRET